MNRFSPNYQPLLLLVLLTLFPFSGLQAESQPQKTYFLNISALKIKEILPPPPANDASNHKDKVLLKDAMAASTRRQFQRAFLAAHDSVFNYSQVLGHNFNAKRLPLTAALFKKVGNDSKIAIQAAKKTFARGRPSTWKIMSLHDAKTGYSYPSGHTTRAFLWACLLKNLFPGHHQAIMREAREKAWNRVILGRHFPDDVYAGEIYGKYLSKEFLKNPQFQTEWAAVKNEVKHVPLNAPHLEKKNSPQPPVKHFLFF